ncbi:hypothetical protein LINGRAPRIM_LOCUS1835 [Linum grandiflorum]
MQISGIPSVKEGEVRDVLEGITWAGELRYSQAIIETDCQLVHKAIVGVAADIIEFGCLVAECKTKLLSKPGFSVGFVKRDGNGVAHAIARRAVTSIVTVLGEIPPIWLTADLANTCSLESH